MFDRLRHSGSGLELATVNGGIGMDKKRALVCVLRLAGYKHFQRVIHLRFREFFSLPARMDVMFIGNNPDLVKTRILTFQIMFRMRYTCACAHHLHIACAGAALIAHAVLVRDCALADIGDNFHIIVRVGAEATACRYLVIVDHPQAAKAHTFGVVIAGKAEMVASIQPAMIGVSQCRVGIDSDAAFGRAAGNG